MLRRLQEAQSNLKRVRIAERQLVKIKIKIAAKIAANLKKKRRKYLTCLRTKTKLANTPSINMVNHHSQHHDLYKNITTYIRTSRPIQKHHDLYKNMTTYIRTVRPI